MKAAMVMRDAIPFSHQLWFKHPKALKCNRRLRHIGCASGQLR